MRGWLRLTAAMLVVASSPPGVLGQDPPSIGTGDTPSLEAGPVRLARVLELARDRNPGIRAAWATSDAAATRVSEASTLPDPLIQLGIMNFGLPDLNADMPTSMAPSVQLTQRVPFPGTLSLRGDMADASSGMAAAGAAEMEWRVRNRAAGLFYDLYAIDRQTEVMRETLALLRDFQTIARAMYSSGTGRQADVLRADVEVARMDGEIRQMEAVRLSVAAHLNGVLNRSADSSIGSPVLGDLPGSVPHHDTLVAWAEATRPLVERSRTGVDRASAGVALARRMIWPDLTVGVVYGQRDRGQGTERMGSAVVGFTLPIHAGSRQMAARDEAEAERAVALAGLERVRAEVGAEIGALLAELQKDRSLVGLYRDEVLPEARITVESALSSYRVGAVDFATLVDAQLTVNRYEGELFRLLADYGKAIIGLESAVGRLLPPSEALITESPGDS